MKNEHDIKNLSMDDATHIGVVHDYSRTELVHRPMLLRFGPDTKVVFTNPLYAQNVISQHQTWLVQSDDYWHIPGTGVKFDKLTGEQFVENCTCGLLHYAFLKLESVVAL